MIEQGHRVADSHVICLGLGRPRSEERIKSFAGHAARSLLDREFAVAVEVLCVRDKRKRRLRFGGGDLADQDVLVWWRDPCRRDRNRVALDEKLAAAVAGAKPS